jgi:hypothetical protein
MTDNLSRTKSRAKRLRSYLANQDIAITHAQSLEAIAQEDGHRDWNTLAALLAAESEPARATSEDKHPAPALPFKIGDRVTGTYHGSTYAGVILGLETTGSTDVWRVKLHFDAPVEVGPGPNLRFKRQRVRMTVDASGTSVNVLGTRDGHLTMRHL